MSVLYEKIIKSKDVNLLDICELESVFDILISNQLGENFDRKQVHSFPFDKSFKDIYIDSLSSILENEKPFLVNLFESGLSENDQVFEAEVTILGEIGYIRYLFPIPYANQWIKDLSISPVTVDVGTLYAYSKDVELDKTYDELNQAPTIVVKYEHAEPGFFVIDGNHRVNTYKEKGIKEIESFILDESLMIHLFPSYFFHLLVTVHANLNIIMLYMIGEIDKEELQSSYVAIANNDI